MKQVAIQKYLAHYAEPEWALLQPFPHVYHACIAIPALAELESIQQLFGTMPQPVSGRLLVVLVVNANEQTSAAELEDNQRLLAWLQQQGQVQWLQAHLQLLSLPKFDVVVINRSCSTKYLKAKQAVGHARKIAVDCALALYHQGIVLTPWLHCTDADVCLPSDYFSVLQEACLPSNTVAVTYPFVHTTTYDSSLNDAVRVYECYLHQHVKALGEAGCVYDFYAIGSTLAFTFSAYAAVRGVPKRAAGEDFYLLNKLAKQGEIVKLTGLPIKVAGRLSCRTPFGTGQALARVREAPRTTPLFYDPALYQALAFWLAELKQVSFATTTHTVRVQLASQPASAKWAVQITTVLEQLGFWQALEKIQGQASSPQQLQRACLTWFDGFKTMRFLHELRDSGYPNWSYQQLAQDSMLAICPSLS